MKNQKERKYPSVKIRLAPLPIRNLNLGNTLNLEECLNRSVAMDRPLSRMSDLSNFSSNSMISVARSNYEIQSDELRRQSNRNLIEALRSKDIRRRRRNYLNNDQDNYSVDLNFNRSQPNINYQQNNQQQIKRKRDIYDDDEELDYKFFNSNNKTTKFAKTDSLQIPSKNRFVSSQYKNNEIASSYYSINNPINQLNNQFKSNRLTKRSLSNQDLENNRKIFKVPLMVHSNSSSKENTLNVSNSINLSNSSISPINKNNNESQKQISINSSSNSSALFKSLNNSSNEMSVDNSQLIIKDNSNNRLSIDNLSNKNTNEDSFEEARDKYGGYNYKIPEHLHSIDEHMRDENKAKSRLGAFLKAIYNVTANSLLSNSNKTDSNSSTPLNAELNKDKIIPQTSSTITSATITTSNLFNSSSSNNLITTTTTTNNDTKTTDSLKPATQFKFPTLPDLKSTDTAKTTSTTSKVTFNIPNITSTLNKSNTITNATNDSSIFKFGQTANDQTNTKIETSTNSSAVFKFGDSKLDKPKDSIATTTPMFTPPSTTASTNTKFNIQNLSFSFTNKDANSTALNNTSINNKSFGTNLTSSFSIPTTNSTAISNLPSSSMFTFGKDSQNTTTQDLNKSSSNVFKFGNPTSTSTNAISNTITDKPAANTAPVFNFGQSSNQSQKNISTSGFNFSASVPSNNNLNSSLSSKPASTAFTFGNLNTSQQIEQSISKPTNQSLNFSFTQPNKPKENAGYNFNLNPNTNLNNSITSSKPAFNFGAPANNLNPLTTSTPFKFENNNNNNNFNQINKPPSINFGLQSSQTNNTNQLKPTTQNPPSFNFASATQPNSFQFGTQSTMANKPENSFTSSTFNFNPSTSNNNIFTIGRK